MSHLCCCFPSWKKKKKSLSHHSKFALGKSVRVYWKEELKVRGSCLKQFYYWLITDFITQEAEQNKLKRPDSRLLKTLRKCGMTKPKMKTWNRISILIHVNSMCMFIYMCGLPRWLSGKESACQCRWCRMDPWVGKILWRRKWQPNSSIPAWDMPWTEEPGGLQSMGSQSQTQLSD